MVQGGSAGEDTGLSACREEGAGEAAGGTEAGAGLGGGDNEGDGRGTECGATARSAAVRDGGGTMAGREELVEERW